MATKKISELTSVNSVQDSDLLIIETSEGTRAVAKSGLLSDIKNTFMTKVYLAPSAWDADTKTQTVSVEGILADETKQSIEVSPYNKEHIDLVTKYGIYCSGQGNGTLTFTAKNIPDVEIQFTIEWKDVVYIQPAIAE